MTKAQIPDPEHAIAPLATELPTTDKAEWKPPTSSKVGWEDLSAAQLRDAAFADSAPILPDSTKAKVVNLVPAVQDGHTSIWNFVQQSFSPGLAS